MECGTGNLFWLYLWGIETKHIPNYCRMFHQFWLYLWGIETSSSSGRQSNTFFILTLPMRNWNDDCYSDASYVDKFWLYLWGIETCNKQKYAFFQNLFWLYLWGIETCEARPNFLIKPLHFDSTYEELKLLNTCIIFF